MILVSNRGAPETVRVAEGMCVKDYLDAMEKEMANGEGDPKRRKGQEKENESEWKEVNGKLFLRTETFGIRIFANVFFLETRPAKEFISEKTKFVLGFSSSPPLLICLSFLRISHDFRCLL